MFLLIWLLPVQRLLQALAMRTAMRGEVVQELV